MIKQLTGAVTKIPKIGLAILILFLIAIILSAQILISQEKKKHIQDIQDQGTYLVSLISLYPLKGLTPDRRDFFLRTLMEYTLHQGLLYLFIHNETGQILISVVPPEISSKIPDDIQRNSVYAATLIKQAYRPSGLSYTVYEFAKPVFEGSRRAGAVRLGLKLPSVTIFSMERVSLLAMIAFFIFTALLVAYYGMSASMRSLKEIVRRRTLQSGAGADSQSFDRRFSFDRRHSNTEQVIPILKDVERSLADMDNRLNEIKEDNLKLISRLGVASFEKNQIIGVLDSINFGIIITDFQDHITFINEYMLKLINNKSENIINRTLDRIFQQKEVMEFISRNEMIESTAGTNYIEISFPDQAPGEVFQVSLSHLTSGERTTTGKMISVKNVTSISMARRAQQEFIAHVAHELMTPLTNVRAYSEMLMDGEVENAEMEREFYNTINQETNRLTGLIQNLLNISKMEMGNLTLNKNLVRTDVLVGDCLTTIEAKAQSKNITIEKHLPDTMPSLLADKELLKTAIINILGNAVKYTPENGKITFSMDELGNTIIFDIADTGYGISQEDIPHIFEKFYRSSNSDVTNQTGSGLGLSIMYEIVHLHDGDVEVQSKLGEGSRFTIRIPKEEYTIGGS